MAPRSSVRRRPAVAPPGGFRKCCGDCAGTVVISVYGRVAMRRAVWRVERTGTHCAGEQGLVLTVLIPEDISDQDELMHLLDDHGVRRWTFTQRGLLGRLDFPAAPAWDHDGAVRLAVTSVGQVRPLDIWFWVVETAADGGRRQVHWSLSRDPETAVAWECDAPTRPFGRPNATAAHVTQPLGGRSPQQRLNTRLATLARPVSG